MKSPQSIVLSLSVVCTALPVFCDAFAGQGKIFACTSTKTIADQCSFSVSDKAVTAIGPLHSYAMDQDDFDYETGLERSKTMDKNTNEAYITNEAMVASTIELNMELEASSSENVIDLPMRRDDSYYAQKIPQAGPVASAEMIIGRIAMVAAVALCVGELTTGASIAQQVTDLL
jgi:hypothetical protein